MFSFCSIGRDFGDRVPPTPASPDSGDASPTATRLPPEALPSIAPADIAKAIRLSLAACGLMLSDNPALSGTPEGTIQPATNQYPTAPVSDQTRYLLRPASSVKLTDRAQCSLRRR
ncbi:hypothetical protein EST38_g12310 [Candolleomyces aberdarensis]|uniref:Uncharacterized protein n=1 Tax=Candolleomyces aberdarensis TaxID=2316362 RepID=A0A4Q2D3H3_9AGAR|nr:hypothetical protein EST38_g12310 [Candolleomyces aberdarensis]